MSMLFLCTTFPPPEGGGGGETWRYCARMHAADSRPKLQFVTFGLVNGTLAASSGDDESGVLVPSRNTRAKLFPDSRGPRNNCWTHTELSAAAWIKSRRAHKQVTSKSQWLLLQVGTHFYLPAGTFPTARSQPALDRSSLACLFSSSFPYFNYLTTSGS